MGTPPVLGVAATTCLAQPLAYELELSIFLLPLQKRSQLVQDLAERDEGLMTIRGNVKE
jgi:hypothetical protein